LQRTDLIETENSFVTDFANWKAKAIYFISNLDRMMNKLFLRFPRVIPFIFVVYLIFSSGFLFGQNNRTDQIVVGNVGSKSSSAEFFGIENVTVKLFIGDEKEPAGISSSKGDGSYLVIYKSPRNSGINDLKIEFSHLEYHDKAIEVNYNSLTDTMILDDVVLEKKNFRLDTVKVISKQNEIDFANGKVVVNITELAERNTTNASDLLKRAPGVMINGSTVSLMARENVLILVDGKKIGIDNQQALRFVQNMPSNRVDKIELVSNPPAKYDAEGYGGVINIVTKKNLSDGIFGNISWILRYGDYFKTTPNINVNFLRNKLKTTFSLNTPFNKSGQTYINERRLPSQIINQDMRIISQTRGVYPQLRVSYDLDSNNVVGLNLGFNSSNNKNIFGGVTNFIIDERIDNTLERAINEAKDIKTTIINVDYNKKIKGGTLALLGDYILYRNSQKTGYSMLDRNIHLPAQFSISNPTNTDIRTVQVDLEQDLLGGVLSFGSKFSNIYTKNIFSKDSLINKEWSNIDAQSSDYRYNESTVAGYTSFAKTIDTTLSGEIGLRYEYTFNDSKLISTIRKDFQNRYGNLFPNLSITKRFSSGRNLLKFSIGRRITRPNYKDLNPFLFYIDQYDYSSGNPYLKPSTATTADLIFLYNKRITFVVGYTDSKNEFQKIIEQDDNSGIAIERYENLAKFRAFSFNSTIPIKLNNWWEMYNVFNISYRNYLSTFGNNKGTLLQFFTEQSFNLYKDINSFISFNYAAADAYGLYLIRPYWTVNLGVSAKIKENFDVKFSVSDLFKSNDRLTIAHYSNVNQQTRNVYEGRIYQLSFAYKFGNRNVKASKRKVSDTAERDRL